MNKNPPPSHGDEKPAPVLTEARIEEIFQSIANDDPEVHIRFARAIEAATRALPVDPAQASPETGAQAEPTDQQIRDTLTASIYAGEDDIGFARRVLALRPERPTLREQIEALPRIAKGEWAYREINERGAFLERDAVLRLFASPIEASARGGLTDDARDAARYRWLRAQVYVDQRQCILRIANTFLRTADGSCTPDQLNAAIDAALAATNPKTPASTGETT